MTRGRKFHREFADDRAMLCDIAGKRDMLLRLNVKIIQIASPVWERNFYMVSDDRAYLAPAARSFRQFVLNGISW